MAKDPAFLFYSQDFLIGISDLTFEERGQYITLLCIQHQKGRLTKKAIQIAVPNVNKDVLSKFIQDDKGLFYNKRLEIEAIKRKEHADKQRQRALDGWKKRKENKLSQSYATANAAALPLEDENENEIINKSETEEKTIKFISEKFGITEMKHFLNFKTIHDCVVCQYSKGDTLFKHFKDQCYNYFLYKDKAEEKLHAFKTFIGSPEKMFMDGGWNAENWIKKFTELNGESENSHVQPKDEDKNKVYYSNKRNKYETDLTKIGKLKKTK
jgi:hypothetical protein